MAGAIGLIARHGKIAYFETYGMVLPMRTVKDQFKQLAYKTVVSEQK